MRRYIGCSIPALLGRSNLTPPEILRFWQAICIAIHRPAAAGGEPGFRVTKITAAAIPAEARGGHIGFAIAGIYFPRGHLGDFSVGIPKTLTIGSVAATLRAFAQGN